LPTQAKQTAKNRAYTESRWVLLVAEASMFFFEKKNQKTFANLTSLYPGQAAAGQPEVFCFFFALQIMRASRDAR
jgi:hypothetical protein